MARKCSIIGCNETRLTSRLYNFPKYDKMRAVWMSYIAPNNPDLLLLDKWQLCSKKVCARHFENDHLYSSGKRRKFGHPTLITPPEITHGVPLRPPGCSDHAYCQPTSPDDDATCSSTATNIPDVATSEPFGIPSCSDHAYCQPTSPDDDATCSSTATNIPDDATSEPFGIPMRYEDHQYVDPTRQAAVSTSASIRAASKDADHSFGVPLPTDSDEIKSLRRGFCKFIGIPLPLQCLKEKVKLIDKTAAWLTDENIPDETKATGVEVIFSNKLSYPEIANHPTLLQMLIKPKDESGGIFNEDLFQSKMKPIIVKLFKSNEARVRLKLLDCFSDYVHTFTEEELKLVLLPEILKGMQDMDKMIVRATLLCLAHLVEILGPQVVIGGTRQELFVYNNVGPRKEIVGSAENKEKRNYEADNHDDAENRVNQGIKREIKKSDAESNDDSANETDSEYGTKNRVNKTQKKRDIKESNEESNDDSANETDSDIDAENRVKENIKIREINASDEDVSNRETEKQIPKRKRTRRYTTDSDDSDVNDSITERNLPIRKCKDKKIQETESSDSDKDYSADETDIDELK